MSSEHEEFELRSNGSRKRLWLPNFMRYHSDALTHRRLRTGLSWVTAALFIVADIAGGGVVIFPVALLNSGLFAGSIAMFSICFAFCYTAHLIGKNWVTMCDRWPEVYGKVHCRKPYPEMAYRAMGNRARFFTATALNIMNFGVSTVYLLIAARIISELWSSFSTSASHNIGLCTMVPILALFLFPITLLKSPQDFWWAVVTAMVTTSLSVLFIIFGTYMDKSLCAPYAHYPKFYYANFFLSIGIFFFSFGGHSVFPTIQHDMRSPKKFTRSAILGFTIVASMYIPIALLGYRVYGDSLHDSIISSIQTTWIQQFANLFIALHCILTLTVVINPLNQEIEHLLDIPHHFCWQRILVRGFVMGTVVFMALTVPSFGPILNLIGGTTVALTSAILPCLFDLYLHAMSAKKEEEHRIASFDDVLKKTAFPKLALNIGVIVLAIVCGLAATYSAFLELSASRFSGPCYYSSTTTAVPSDSGMPTAAKHANAAIESMHCCGAYRNISKHIDVFQCPVYVPVIN